MDNIIKIIYSILAVPAIICDIKPDTNKNQRIKFAITFSFCIAATIYSIYFICTRKDPVAFINVIVAVYWMFVAVKYYKGMKARKGK